MNPFDGTPVNKKLTPKEKAEVLQLLLNNPKWLSQFRSLLNIPSGGSGGGGTGSAITVYDEGVSLTTALNSLDFVGSGVTATTSGNNVTVTVSSGGISDGDKGDVTVSAGGAVMDN